MARNKQLQDRAEKRDEVVAAARGLFHARGYDSTSMSQIADAAGVTTNTIYWYFRDKDDLLIAVLDEIVSDAWSEYQTVSERPIAEILTWLLARLQQADQLVTTVHARIAISSQINEWHDRFHVAAEGTFRNQLVRAGVSASTVDAEVRIGVFAFEGMLIHGLGDVANLDICNALASRWES